MIKAVSKSAEASQRSNYSTRRSVSTQFPFTCGLLLMLTDKLNNHYRVPRNTTLLLQVSEGGTGNLRG